MFNSAFRKKLEGLLQTLLPPNTPIKSSTLLQAYVTFSAIRSKKNENYSTAYMEIIAETKSYPRGVLQLSQTSFSASTASVFDQFLALDPESFFRYIISDLISNPTSLLQVSQKHLGSNLPLLAHHIIQIKYTYYKFILGNFDCSDDEYNDAITKIYATYCSLETNKSVRLSQSVFTDFYNFINLYSLDSSEFNLVLKDSNHSKLYRIADILSNDLEFSREQQFEVVRCIFVKNESEKQIIAQFPTYHFERIQPPEERRKVLREALHLISVQNPFDVLSALSIYKRHSKIQPNSLSYSSVIRNDIPLENGLIYPLFISRTLLDPTLDSSILIFNPSLFFVQKWLKDPATRGKKVTFIFQSSAISDVVNYHFQEGTYAPPLDKNVSFLCFEQWRESLVHSPKTSNNTQILLFACGMSLSEQTSWYQLIKQSVPTSADIFILLSSYEFEQAHSPFSSELDDPHLSILTVETIPQGINNSTSPRRKIFMHCLYSVEESALFGTTKISAFTLKTDLKTQALSKMFDAPVEIEQHNLVGLYNTIRELYRKELLKRKSTGRKNAAAISYEFTPDITIWCSKTYPANNRGRPRLEAYICLPKNQAQAEDGTQNRNRGAIIEGTKKHTVKIPNENISGWLESDYPFSKVQPRRSSGKLSDDEPLAPSTSIREQVIDQYTPYLSGKNIALKTFWYLYPNLESLFSAADYSIFSEMACSEIGFLPLDQITPSICEDYLVTYFPDDSRDRLLGRIGILSTVLGKAVEYSYCTKNLLYPVIHEQHLRNKLFSQVRNALTKKHFTEAELLKAFTFIDQRIQAGELEYLGVMIRLLTGLDSNTICALKWKDIQEIVDYNISKIVITRQITNDGEETKGFDSLEDYLCFPCSLLLQKYLNNQYSQTKHLISSFSNLEDCFIVNSHAAILDPKKRYTAFPPRELEKLCKETIKAVGIEDRIIEIPNSEKGTKETNLNRYQGDFFRENFRHWALTRAKLTADETLYLLGNKPQTTFGIYYCDFLNDASQLTIFVKLLRWDAVFTGNRLGYAQSASIPVSKSFQKTFPPITNGPLHIHMRILAQNGAGQLTLRAESQYGESVLIAPISLEPEVDSHGNQ